ncbi:hypothetical protein [Hanstruepera marina]|uniref:hypothetical protein n=1 Tax=Hanstruepera marina TaxID=2873265 RepID=UPI001CA762A3|nr:hypothetical protein [Hanstruepera marina]
MRALIIFIVFFTIIMLYNCKSAKETSNTNTIVFEEKPSFELDKVYFQKWVAGVQGGGSGIHMYVLVKTNKTHVEFDNVYFRGLKAKLILGKIGYLANFKTPLNQKKDIIMDADSKQEYGNKLPENDNHFPFTLQDNECVIQYTENGNVKFYKVEEVVEKKAEYYPSAPNNNQKQ